MTGKQWAIDLATKVAIINAVETGIETKSEIARCYELPRSTLSTILKNKSLSICLLHPSSSTRMWRTLFLAGLSRLGA